MAHSSPRDYSNCACDDGYISLGDSCKSLLIIIVPIGFVGMLIIIGSYCIIRIKRKNALNGIGNRANIHINNNVNHVNNNINLNNQQNNQANIINNNNNRNANNSNNNNNIMNHRNIRLQLENRILKPLDPKDQIHGNKCIFGDESPPFWEFDCGAYMCNPCSLKLVTNLNTENINCTKCTKPFSYFKFVNRYIENEDSVDLKDKSIIKIESIKSDSLNNSVNETQNDSTCKICFVLKHSKQIKCDSNTPHMLCTYCYHRLINIEEIPHCPFCRNDIHH